MFVSWKFRYCIPIRKQYDKDYPPQAFPPPPEGAPPPPPDDPPVDVPRKNALSSVLSLFAVFEYCHDISSW